MTTSYVIIWTNTISYPREMENISTILTNKTNVKYTENTNLKSQTIRHNTTSNSKSNFCHLLYLNYRCFYFHLMSNVYMNCPFQNIAFSRWFLCCYNHNSKHKLRQDQSTDVQISLINLSGSLLFIFPRIIFFSTLLICRCVHVFCKKYKKLFSYDAFFSNCKVSKITFIYIDCSLNKDFLWIKGNL